MVNPAPHPVPPWAAGTEGRMDELNPGLTEEQIAIVCRYGKEASFEDGAWLWRAGQRDAGFHLVMSREIEIVDTKCADQTVIITHGRGHYGGEIVTMTGRGALVGGRAKGDVTTIALTSEQLRSMIALESQLGETMLLSFILRRMRMVAEMQGDVVLYGVEAEAETGKLRSFLSRHSIPAHFVDVTDDGAQAMLQKLGMSAQDRPIVTTGQGMLVRPTIRDLAEHVQIAAEIEDGAHFDVVIVGGGPAGLAAAVYGASEGLSALVIESIAPGGQAATSSRIENFFGFPTGISGQALTGRGFLQAHKFGAEIAPARSIEKIECGPPHRLHLDGGETVTAGAVVIASGAIYREPPIENLDRFTGGGVHYGASHVEAQLCKDDAVMLDGKGFVMTGPDLTADALAAAGWSLERRPTHLETTCPGIYAVGDVRSGSVKRVASAVGEGSVCIQFVHQVIAEA